MTLKIFKAQNSPIALIIRKSNQGKSWQLIKWDLETDTFESGQWILNKQLFVDGCAISPNGEYFYWIYNTYQNSDINTHIGISKIPYFTALMYGSGTSGRWSVCKFDSETYQPIAIEKMESRNGGEIQFLEKGNGLPNGLMPSEWTDIKNRTITTDGYKVFADGEEIYDCSNHQFEETIADYIIV
jgi:hypothetical protein